MTFSVDVQNHLLAREGIMPRWLLWVKAVEFGTLVPNPLGFATGSDHLAYTVDGEDRTYFGGLGAFELDPVVYGTGLDVRALSITLDMNTPQVEDLVRGFLIKMVPVELHLALLDPVTTNLIGLDCMFRGFMNRAPVSSPPEGQGGDLVAFELLSSMRRLALPGPALKKTNQSHLLRDATDDFRQYGAVAAEVQTEWVKK